MTLCVVLAALALFVVSSTSTPARNDVAGISDDKTAALARIRQARIAQFLEQRRELSPLCLYTFDQPKHVALTTQSSNTSTSPLLFENHVPHVCPFGDLLVDAALVESLNTPEYAFQLGVRLHSNTSSDRKRVQIGSTDVAFARDLYSWAIATSKANASSEHTGGVTFELVVRLHASSVSQHHKRTGSGGGSRDHRRSSTTARSTSAMTLFSIANVYDGCVDPGIRVDVDSDRRLVLVYYLPMETIDREPECYESLLTSSNEDVQFEAVRTTCVLPTIETPDGKASGVPVSIAVTIDPVTIRGSWRSDFAVTYTHPTTLERVHCSVSRQTTPPMKTRLVHERVTGTLRLYIGNSPHNVSTPLPRHAQARARTFRPLSREDLSRNATERLRATLLQKLLGIKGPKIPTAMRFLGDKSISFKLFGIELPPVNEDSPFAYMRGKLRDFLMTNGPKMVDHVISLLRKVQPVVETPDVSIGDRLIARAIAKQQERQRGNASTNATTVDGDYPDAADVSRFDLFYFAIYKTPLAWLDVKNGTFASLGPLRPLPTLDRDVRIQEDEAATLDLTMLQSVYDDVQLELRSLPERGKLLMLPNRTVVTPSTMAQFRDLPPAYHSQLVFEPAPDENNANLPLPHAFAFSRRRAPYSVVDVGVFKSRTGRAVNTSSTARIRIFVAAANDAPRPLQLEQRAVVTGVHVPVELDLHGDDADGSPPPTPAVNSSESASPTASTAQQPDSIASIMDQIRIRHVPLTTSPAPSPQQFVKVARLPQFGKLYDCRMASQNTTLTLPLALNENELEAFRITLDSAANQTFSTQLMYIYSGYGRADSSSASVVRSSDGEVVDELAYQLNDGDPSAFSKTAVVQFVWQPTSSTKDDASRFLKIVELQEDASIALTLADVEPLVGLLDARSAFHIVTFPQHGALYQYRDPIAGAKDTTAVARGKDKKATTEAAKTYRIGRKLSTASRIIDDVDGRVVYVPDRDYYNTLPRANAIASRGTHQRLPLDSFAFEPVNVTAQLAVFATASASNATASHLPLAARRPRVVGIRVVGEPDELVLLPPTHFVATKAHSRAVPVPVRFDDPDARYDGQYFVTVRAKDGFSRFVVGANVSNDDVMRFCNLTRPCLLTRSLETNATALNDSSSSRDVSSTATDSNLTFTYYVQHAILTPYFVSVIGTKRALERALAAMTYTDWSIHLMSARRVQFTVSIKRVNDRLEATSAPVTAVYAIDFPAALVGGVDDMVAAVVDVVTSQVEALLWTLLMTALVAFVITNSSCFSTGAACCSSRAREHRRHAFETERARFEAHVAQNDYEYSLLLLDVADVLLSPDLTVATSLVLAMHGVSSAGSSKDASTTPLLLLGLESVLPVLESERQGVCLVFRLMVLEYESAVVASQTARSPQRELEHTFLSGASAAGRALALFCRSIGRNWLRQLVAALQLDMEQQQQTCAHDNSALVDSHLVDLALDTMCAVVAALPVEIVILCRACARLFERASRRSSGPASVSTAQRRAVHLVFCCHFVGPALRFGLDHDGNSAADGSRRSVQRQQQRLAALAKHLVALTQRWDAPDRVFGDQSSARDDAYVLMRDDNERAEHCERLQLRRYEELLHMIVTSDTLESSFDPTVARESAEAHAPDKKTNPSTGTSSGAKGRSDTPTSVQVDSTLMGLCLMNVHSLLDAFWPQFEKQLVAIETRERAGARTHGSSGSDYETATAELLPRLQALLRALSFPSVNIHSLAQQMACAQRTEWLCQSSGLSAHEWLAFANPLRRASESSRSSGGGSQLVCPQTSECALRRTISRSQSLLAVHVEDNLCDLDDSALSTTAERF